jgi:hypothetical protein
MESLTNIIGLLVCAAALTAVVLIGLRLAIPKDPRAPDPERPRLRNRIAAFGISAAFIVVELLASAVVTAYGAPVGDSSEVVVEVREAGDCRRPLSGFGLVQSCKAGGYSSTVPSERYLERGESPTVLGGDAVGPGDRITEYTAVGWDRWLMPMAEGSQWRSVADEDRPNLLWLPAAALVATVLALGALSKALRRWKTGRVAVAETSA